MKKIEIVTHCQSIHCDFYADLLVYQLSSFVLYPPKQCDLKITICYCSEDVRTCRVLEYFESLNVLNFNLIDMDLGKLGRRAIGRNIAAKATDADIVWFTDVDYVFRGCLDTVASLNWPKEISLMFPKIIQNHRNFDLGFEYINRIHGKQKVVDVEPKDFKDLKMGIPIGGIQIVKGSVAKNEGYCATSKKRQSPTDGTFVRCMCDITFHKTFTTRRKKVDIPGVFRLRHPVREIQHALKMQEVKETDGCLRMEHSVENYMRMRKDSSDVSN